MKIMIFSSSSYRSFRLLLFVLGGALVVTTNARLLSSSTGTTTTSSTTSEEKSCDLDCPRNAPCRFGHADFSGRTGILDAQDTHRNGMHCDCPIGWTGILCDQKYETCTNQQGHECYNGGKCILGLEDRFGNEQLFCDCSKTNGFVGKYCETPSKKTCKDNDEDVFCVNGGACNPDFPVLSSRPCFCDEGWEGFHCEYKKDLVPECSLDCQNGGTCFVGTSGDASENHRWYLNDSKDHMFCKCPRGFGGPLCEAPAEYCGNSKGHVCLNGGTCVATNVQASNGMLQSQQHHCDCTTASNENKDSFAGKYCEHKATSICANSDWETFFCTQGGACKGNPMEGCSCPEGTAGFKCEFILDGSDQNIGISVPNKIQDTIEEMYDDDVDSGEINNHRLDNACGDGYCLNGGSCVTEQILMQGGSFLVKEYCDCSQAYDASANYAGVFCQYKSTSLCLIDNSLKDAMDSSFCVHFGKCQDDGSCDCPLGWTGQHCELKALEMGGTSASQVGSDVELGREYIEVDECGDSICYNGGTCVRTERQISNGEFLIETHCDCAAAFDEKYLYAGLSCEFPSTEICSIPKDGQDLSGSSFCTNHGACKRDSELSCDCPTGFFGSACEYEMLEPNRTFDEMKEDDDDVHLEFCGNGICHHGGTCVTSVVYSEEIDTSVTKYTCDCSTAYDGETAYLGASCEYPATTFCIPPKNGENPSSTRFCVNHGTCSEDPSKDCDCGSGFGGRFCEYKINLDQSDADGNGDEELDDDQYDQDFELCGDKLICFNGGTCVLTIFSDDYGETNEVRTCDCDSASNGIDFFAGASCEYKATSVCPTSSKSSFCVNGGKCQQNGVCDCELPWKGSHCEFPFDAKGSPSFHTNTSNDDPMTGCKLKCMNGGVCVQGAKNLGAFQNSIEDIAQLNQTYAEGEFAHCVCADGYIGLTCENQVEVCGDNQHFCLHGSKCISDANADRGYSCDCSQAGDTAWSNGEAHLFIGDSCQYVDVDICTIGNEYLQQPLYFCVNGGSCKAKVYGDVSDPGCRCPDNYAGPHCEVHLTTGEKRKSSSQENRLALIAGLLIPIIGMLALVASHARSLLLTVRKNKAVPTDDAIPVTRTSFSPRRRRRAGFGNGSTSNHYSSEYDTNSKSSSFDTGEGEDFDATTSAAGQIEANEGIMSDCSLAEDVPPRNSDNENSSTDGMTKLRESHFV